MAWKVIIHLLLLSTLVCLCAGELRVKPRDTDVKVNQSTYFNCSTDIMSTDIFWFHGTNYIYTGIAILEPYHERFMVDRDAFNGTYTYNLVIHSVQPGDAGEYICIDDEGLGGRYSAQLVVLDGDPICRSNIELDEVIGQNTCKVEPDEVELSCGVTYHGNFPPQLEWKKVGHDEQISEGLSNAISTNQYNYILKLKGDLSIGKSSYVCQATRIAHEPRKCISKDINVLYVLGDNSTVNRSIDDEIICHANTTQSCKYKWRWFQNNDVTTESSSAILRPRKTGLHKCEAECYLRNETCNLLVMEAMVYGDIESSQARKVNSSVVVVVTVVVTLVVLVALLFVFRHRIVKNRNKEKATRDVLSLIIDEGVPLNQPPNYQPGDDRAFSSINEMTKHLDSKFHIMGAAKSMNFQPSVLDKVAATDYFLSKEASGGVYGPIPWQDSQLAVKQVLFQDGNVTVDFKRRIEAKKDIWTSLRHKNLMRIHWVDLTKLPESMFIVMDFATGGSLCKTVQSEQKLPIDVVTDWAKQIAEGMLYLHEKNIIHRDLKSSNIMLMKLFDAGSPHTVLTLKIADFDEIREHDHTTTMSTFGGTCAHLAPEVLKVQRFSKASDVWSFGVVIWEMLSGDIPHRRLEPSAIMSKSINCELDNLHLEPSFPGDFKLLLNRCWESTYSKRIPFDDISSILQRLGLPEIYKSDPVLIETIRIEAVKIGNEMINGLTILDKELFVVSGSSSQIQVYDSIKLSLRRRFNLNEICNPMDITSCSRNKSLYILDFRIQEPMEILRVDSDGKLIKKWSTERDYGCVLSVTAESNVILTNQLRNQLSEYSPDGELIREINLSDAGIRYPSHAIKLTNGHFLVCHSNRDDDLHRVCIVDADGKLIIKSFGGERGSSITQMNYPIHLSIDRNGFVFVADEGNDRILLLDSNLGFKTDILKKGNHTLQCPRRILLDESTSRAFVAEWSHAGSTIKIFQFDCSSRN